MMAYFGVEENTLAAAIHADAQARCIHSLALDVTTSSVPPPP